MQRLKSQNSRFHGLISKLKLDADEKKEIVIWASKGRCTSSRDLTASEMRNAIDKLTGQYDSRIARMQAKARAIANDLGLLPVVSGKVDYTAMNTFIMKIFKVKSLFDLEYKQLIDCITALERWRDGRTKKMVKVALNGV
jgi:hypothetical protein